MPLNLEITLKKLTYFNQLVFFYFWAVTASFFFKGKFGLQNLGRRNINRMELKNMVIHFFFVHEF